MQDSSFMAFAQDEHTIISRCLIYCEFYCLLPVNYYKMIFC